MQQMNFISKIDKEFIITIFLIIVTLQIIYYKIISGKKQIKIYNIYSNIKIMLILGYGNCHTPV